MVSDKTKTLLESVAHFCGEHAVASVCVDFADGTKAELWIDSNGKVHAADVSEWQLGMKVTKKRERLI